MCCPSYANASSETLARRTALTVLLVLEWLP
jgi:hypothetical protein